MGNKPNLMVIIILSVIVGIIAFTICSHLGTKYNAEITITKIWAETKTTGTKESITSTTYFYAVDTNGKEYRISRRIFKQLVEGKKYRITGKDTWISQDKILSMTEIAQGPKN